MLNLSRRSHSRSFPDNCEAIDRPVFATSAKPRLPRHISAWETSGRNQAIASSLYQAPNKCPLDHNLKSAQATNLAVNILRYQLQDHVAQQKHWENLRCNLQHRLEVARSTNNTQLLTILQAEFRQLETT